MPSELKRNFDAVTHLKKDAKFSKCDSNVYRQFQTPIPRGKFTSVVTQLLIRPAWDYLTWGQSYRQIKILHCFLRAPLRSKIKNKSQPSSTGRSPVARWSLWYPWTLCFYADSPLRFLKILRTAKWAQIAVETHGDSQLIEPVDRPGWVRHLCVTPDLCIRYTKS